MPGVTGYKCDECFPGHWDLTEEGCKGRDIYTHTYAHTDIHTYTHTHIHTYTHKDIHTYRHTHIHIYCRT